MEKLNPNAVASSLGITAVILYVICLILVAIFPLRMIVPFASSMLHSVDFTVMMVKNISFASSIIGIIGWFVIAAVTGYIFAFVYNLTVAKF